MSSEVIVVGGGAIGLTTAVTLAESGTPVRVWSREQVDATTSAVAGALWWPYRIEPAERVGAWSLASLRVYEHLARSPDETGVRLVEGVMTGTALAGLGPWAADVPGLREDPYGLVLGGTAQEDNWDTDPDPAVARAIVERCSRVRPEVAGAGILEHRVGLRPARAGGVRPAAERLPSGALCVHNYGHGGAGVTVAWGCARDAARLVAG
ncbi:FAD-dependent oxidoreductase [Streptomyces sp. H27-C3]|uniref:FAD-dependent oxidoreductase n=1 Tax=Streptomyces sp. H27-C3 TaxID=3046305 RepID=UPI0024BA0019|nr:FAD-dependent oxidoreductase [Streptomyces sp. H27-C3]MDJ0465651.1 FAD-dependent oxidoreductase [Streptomyces sp. H27-C3]